MAETPNHMGRVTRCSTRGFVGAVRMPEPDLPTFGAYCKAEAQGGRTQVVGLIYDISIEDDALARQVATAEGLTPEQLADAQRNRQVPIEYHALSVGYLAGDACHHRLPPQPPLTLAPVEPLTEVEIAAFTERLDFIPLLLAAPDLPIDDLLVAALGRAAALRPESERRGYLLEAGRACARLLAGDLNRLEKVLQGLAA